MYCKVCGSYVSYTDQYCPHCGAKLDGVVVVERQVEEPIRKRKNHIVAGILALLLGGIGIHKFYLGKVAAGVLYLLFSWTFIPSIIAFIEGIIYLVDEDGFNQKYNR